MSGGLDDAVVLDRILHGSDWYRFKAAKVSELPVQTKSDLHFMVKQAFPSMMADHSGSTGAGAATEEENIADSSDAFQGLYWSPSGGTGGQALYFPTAVEENVAQRRCMADLFSSLGVFTNKTICGNLFGGNQMYRSMEIFSDYVVLNQGTLLPIGHDCPDEKAFQLLERFRANTIAGSPPRLTQLASFMKQRGLRLPLVKLLVFATEPLYPSKRAFLENVFPGVSFSSAYGSAEGGVWAAQPTNCTTDCYVVCENAVKVEIVDANGAEQEGFGRIVLSNKLRTRFPVLRFDTGDVGRFEVGADGRKLLRVKGRNAAYSFSLSTNYYDLPALEGECPLLQRCLDYQVELFLADDGLTDVANFRVVVPPADEVRPDSFLPELLTQLSAAIKEEDTKIGFKVTLTQVTIGDLFRSETGNKVLKIVDRRKK